MDSSRQKWMALLLAVHLIVPSFHYYPSYPSLVLTWFAFDWFEGGWILFIPYMFVGLPAFLLIGLPTIIPLLLVGLMIFNRKVHRSRPALLCLVLSSVLSAVYLYGWICYTWPTPYQPVQTASIVLFTFLAYKNWSSIKENQNKQTI